MEPQQGQAESFQNVSNEFQQETRTEPGIQKLPANTSFLGDIAAEIAGIHGADRLDFRRDQENEPDIENTTGFVNIHDLLLMEADPTPGEQITELILRDFCSSPTYFEEHHETANETSPWFRFRHKKIKTYSKRRIPKEEPPPVTIKYEEEEEDRLSCSSGLSVQEDFTTPATTSVCELDANTSQKIYLPSKKEPNLEDSLESKEDLCPISDTQSSVEYSAVELQNFRDELLESDYTFEASQNCDIKPRGTVGDTIFGDMESIKNTDSKVCEDWSEGDSFLENINTEQISLNDDKGAETENKTRPSEIKSENYEILLHDIPITEWQTPMDVPDEKNIESKESVKDAFQNKASSTKDITDTQFLQEFPLEDWQPDEVTEFVGFRTASNKQIHISEETKLRAAKLLSDLDAEDVQKETATNVPEFVGFRTASNKAIKISDETKKRAAKFIADFEAEEHQKDSSNEDSETINEFVGFRTASNKAIAISEETKQRAAALLADLEAEDPQRDTGDGNTAKLDDFVGFRTASNKAIAISKEMETKGAKFLAQFNEEEEKALAADTEFLESIAFSQWEPLDTPDTDTTRRDTSKANDMEIKGTTADDNTSTFEVPADPSMNTSQSANIPQLVAFHKTSYKFMEVSQEMRVKGDKLMADVIAGTPSASRSLDTPEFVGFRTASNRPIEITEEMKKKAAKLIAEVEASVQCNNQHNIEKELEGNNDFVGFRTASNKNIVVSEEMQKKAAKFMAEIQADEIQVNENQITAEAEFVGFRTASNKSITVSEEMKKKAAKLMAEVQAEEGNSNILSSKINKNKEQAEVQVESTNQLENIEKTKVIYIISNNNNIECQSDESDEVSGEEFQGFPNNDMQPIDPSEDFVFPRQSQVNVDISDSRVGTPKNRRETTDGIPSSKRRRSNFSQNEQPGGCQLVKTTSCNSALCTPSQSQEMHASLTQLASRSPLDHSTKTSVIARRNLLTLSKRRKRNSATSEGDGIDTPLKPKFTPMAASTSTPLANKNTNLRKEATILQQNVEDMSPICMPPNKSRRLGLSRSRY
ncbi:breast cancer type 2 susceptibility protein homolog isoform X2 [Drosophila ananassae]|uniref:breast cancer type 2 susceptibility protein homolog isoform X2 n=1 Tax=Drosophila ananassae TaxID=7217 RepID=UPI0013A5C051|nr:breast cancer type 2 susceptibility protein homolog isoform X2 [Drosophila ananassae]